MPNPNNQFVPSPHGVGATVRAQKFGSLWRRSPLRVSVSLLRERRELRQSPEKSNRSIATQMTPQRPVATGATQEGELAPGLCRCLFDEALETSSES